jgi:hypothetical protein
MIIQVWQLGKPEGNDILKLHARALFMMTHINLRESWFMDRVTSSTSIDLLEYG